MDLVRERRPVERSTTTTTNGVLSEAVRQHGVHEIGGPLMVGGAEFLCIRTGLFRDNLVRRRLTSKRRFEDHLQFRERASKIAATELVSAANSPVDLFLFTNVDRGIFRSHYLFRHILFGYTIHHPIIVDDQSNGNGVDNNNSTVSASVDDSGLINSYMNYKESLLQILHGTQKKFAYRKGLLKLDICQMPSNNDPEKTIEWLKSSTGWSELYTKDLRCGLKSHIDHLKEHHEISKVSPSSISEYEKFALEKINKELTAELEEGIGSSDEKLMNHYYNRVTLSNLARECAIQARASGVVLVKQGLPVRENWKEQYTLSTSLKVVKLPSMKQTVKQSLEGSLGLLRRTNEKFGRGTARGSPWGFVAFSTIAWAAIAGISSKR